MKKGSVTKFTVDLAKVDDNVFKALLRLGEFEQMGFGTNRWTFPIAVIKEVERLIGDRISFDMRYLKEHIVGVETTDSPARLYITKGMKGDKQEEMLKMKDRVEGILKRDPRSRSSDKWLYMKILEDLGYEIHADYGEVSNLPSWETISRIRRKFQQHEMYLADGETFAVRKEYENQMRQNNDWFKVDGEDGE